MSIIDGDKLMLESRIKALEGERDAARTVAEWNAQSGGFAAATLRNVEAERDKLTLVLAERTVERDRLRDHIHTCGPTCSKAGCVNRRLREAARAVIDRWETPLWKDVAPTADVIYKLRDVLGAT